MNNTAKSNGNGIYFESSNDNVLWENIFCFNTYYDIRVWSGTGNSGDNNTCDKTSNWNDENTTKCTYNCTGISPLSFNFVKTDLFPVEGELSEPVKTPETTPVTQDYDIPTNTTPAEPNNTQTELPSEVNATDAISTPTPAISFDFNMLKTKSMGFIHLIKDNIMLITQVLSPVWASEYLQTEDDLSNNIFTLSNSSSNESYTIWEKNITVSDVNISTIIKDLNATGKLYLHATLYSPTGQIIAYNISTFYVTDSDLSLTVETDEEVYKPGGRVNISGEVMNRGSSKTCNLAIKKDGIEIFSDSFTLNQDESHYFTTNTTSDSSFELEGTVNEVTVTDFIKVEEPSINVTMIAPDIAGREAFDFGLSIENTGNISVDLNVKINSTEWSIAVPENGMQYLETSMSITRNVTVNVNLTGDVSLTMQKEITYGEGAEINVSPEDVYLEGIVGIPYIINNTGMLDTEFNTTFMIGKQTVTGQVYLPAEGNLTNTVYFNLTKGMYFLNYSSPFWIDSVVINVESNAEFVAAYPEDMVFNLGESVNLTIPVKNVGGLEGEVKMRVYSPGLFDEFNITWIDAGEEANITFPILLPDDVEEKSYKMFFELNGEMCNTTFIVQGAKITVEAGLDKKFYSEGENAVLALNITNERENDLELFARVQFNGYENVTYFNLTGNSLESLKFSVPVNFTGDRKMLYSIYMSSGRSLYINSIYVYKDPGTGINLYTDKQVYEIEENATIFINTTVSGELNITAPGYSNATYLNEGNYTQTFTIPELLSGTYYIEYTFNNHTLSYPFDINGYFARILELTLDKRVYQAGDNFTLNALVDVNRDFNAEVNVTLFNPDLDTIDVYSFSQSFVKGENLVSYSGTITSDYPGLHLIVPSVIVDLAGHSPVTVVSGSRYFDVEMSVMCGDVNCNDEVNTGDIILLLNHVTYGYPICNEWTGDVTCDGKINVGDVILILNNVTYGYTLKCC
jgi:parallel beta-helix repeat protein